MFNLVTGFTQVKDNLTIMIDFGNYCLRSINPHTGQTSLYAGHCRKHGSADGQLIGEASFRNPYAITSYQGRFYVTDYGNNALRMIAAGKVSTIMKLPFPRGLIFTADGSAYITLYKYGLFRLDLPTKSMTKLTNGAGPTGSLSAAQLSSPRGLTFLSSSVVLITDSIRQQLLHADISNNTITEICDGTRETRDGDIKSCQLDSPSSVLVVNQSVFVGQDDAIRKLTMPALSETVHPTESTTTSPGESRPVSFCNAFVLINPCFL